MASAHSEDAPAGTIFCRHRQARSHRRPFIPLAPGLRKLLTLAGALGRRTAMTLDVAPELPLPAGLPDDVAVLRAIVRRLLSVQRVLRSEIVVLQGEVRDAADRVAHYRRESQSCAMRFGMCRIAAGHRTRRHSPMPRNAFTDHGQVPRPARGEDGDRFLGTHFRVL